MPRTLPLLCLTLLAIMLPLPEARAQQSLDAWPEWVRESMQNEVGKLTFNTVDMPDDTLTLKLPGKVGQPETIEGGWYLSVDVGAGVPVDCYLIQGARDLATLTHTMAQLSSDAVAAQHGEMIERQFHFVDSGEVAGLPFLAFEWMYTIRNADGQTLVGFTKTRAASKGQRTFMCAHNNLGYRDTFARLFNGFVANAEVPDATPAPYYEEIVKVDLNGIGSGIGYAAFYAPGAFDEEDLIEIHINEASLMPVDRSTIMTSDSTSVYREDPTGAVASASEFAVENDEWARELHLVRDPERENDWAVSGTSQGKEIAITIDGSLEPAGVLRQLEMARDVFAEDATSVDAVVWMPSIDPTTFVPASMTRDDAETERQAQLQMGPMIYTGLFDEDGNMYNADISIGPVTIAIERIWSRGSLRE